MKVSHSIKGRWGALSEFLKRNSDSITAFIIWIPRLKAIRTGELMLLHCRPQSEQQGPLGVRKTPPANVTVGISAGRMSSLMVSGSRLREES